MKKVLLVEHEAEVRDSVVEAVEEVGVACLSCSTGIRAIQFLEDNPGIDLVIVDMFLPELNGEEVIRILRGRNGNKRVPIVVISGQVGYESVSHLLDLGAARFLTKPINREELVDCLHDFLPGIGRAPEQRRVEPIC